MARRRASLLRRTIPTPGSERARAAADRRALGASQRSHDAERLWLAALQRLAEGAAHELKNALNGASLNTQVLRSRSAKGAEGAALVSFAEAASSELERGIALTESLLMLARPQGDPVDLGYTLRCIASLVDAAVRRAGGGVELGAMEAGTTAAPAAATRLALAEALRAAIGDGTRKITVALERVEDRLVLHASAGSMDDTIRAVLDAVGIRSEQSADALMISFDASGRANGPR